MEKYHQEALEVSRSVSRLIALALGLDINFFDQPEMLGNPIATLRLLHYEDDNYGLQICKDKDAKPQIWEYVPPLKGAFIVNLGDMLERWSNCFFRSTLHRVLGNGQERYSIAFFVEPSHECIVECLPTCQSEKNPPNSLQLNVKITSRRSIKIPMPTSVPMHDIMHTKQMLRKSY
ncbi:hypothetical protein SASPL_150391 [Salvia splendens]|uniref:Fe2OG dioxygenase domain-containing protein n=1 Tax=Salvia splendens TaxID=180675 RepID=A0A8X8W6T0_SALSN|nr:hypothetical protein SASPL_150391 [Salvia splendens]